MTLNDPLFMQNLTYTASEDRGIVEVLAGVGVLADGDLKVSQRAAGVNMSVDVAAGTVVIENAVASRGRYLCKSTAVTNLAIAASPGVGASRIDIVVATVTDTEYGDPSDAWVLQVITGTAGPSPTAPATPAGSLLLANIAVGTSVSSISNANITDVRPYARGLTYTNRLPTVAVDGQQVISSTGRVSTRASGSWLTAAAPSQFGGNRATMANTALTGVGAGFATATVAAPAGPVIAQAIFAGGGASASGDTNSIFVVKVQLSFDGGSTWADGSSVTMFTANEFDFQAITAVHLASGTPSGSVKGRVYANRTGSPGAVLSGSLVLTVLPG